ncbi:N-acetylmuramoyl-L-alanine amidase [Rummeliibacillus sp. POC4]|uniref:N-acetylmuramoyl-L-alanine amidase n=1 Tax=Rummeliibacillus sp. POC4 TaxID=2305899 RepID=UPI000E669E32|nr:N-acetylmuramoyl-L-alanine amidase [Rummeliibacillus sp. POC4]RIJ65547.1 N-acetylmuramoyl-L-alanine amidase [Rummeliibacillus sp. POC4]
MTKQFVISSGHGDKVSGAIGVLNEHNEAKKVVNSVYNILTKEYNGKGFKFHDATSTTQDKNLATIVKYHNSKERALDISVHFNSASASATGTECLYYDKKSLSVKMSKAMSDALGIVDRGAKERKELYFLRNTSKPAILLEVCFVSSKKDAAAYHENFEKLCQAIAKVIADQLDYKKTQGKFYDKKFDRLIALTDIGVYKDKSLKHEHVRYKKGKKLDIIDITYDKNGTPRFIVCGGFCSTNREYVKAYTVNKKLSFD